MDCTREGRSFDELLSAISLANHVMLCAHVAPDGDTIGSMLALSEALRSIGKQVYSICADPVPEMLKVLKCADTVLLPDNLSRCEFDLAIAVDVSDENRLGCCIDLFRSASKTMVIDHHATNCGFADINYIDPNAAAVGEIMYNLIHELGTEITVDIAECLFTAISTDTGNFSFDSTTCDAFYISGELRKIGIPLVKLNRMLFRERTKEQQLLLARALNTLSFSGSDKIAYMWLTADDFTTTGAKLEHTEAIVNYGIDIKGVCLSFLAREVQGGVKFSLRALAPYDVAKIAAEFHGGGHKLAAGCTISLPLNEAVELVAEKMEKQLKDVSE